MSASPIPHSGRAADREALERAGEAHRSERSEPQTRAEYILVARTRRPVYCFACLTAEQLGEA